jgi:DGQHR domain-containing protein
MAAKKTISVIVPKSPFTPSKLAEAKHCLAALSVDDLMKWWPGQPHQPELRIQKVKAIQRSLDWNRVAKIAAYLLQQEVVDAPRRLHEIFSEIYEPKATEPGRVWPPRVPRVVNFDRSEYPFFSNVLIHVNGATIEEAKDIDTSDKGRAANLQFDEDDKQLSFNVIDGQHRINGAYLALCLKREMDNNPALDWEIPAEIFLDLDPLGKPPQRQAQIFIDVNFNQKRVDPSLVADLFPTARGGRAPMDNKERAQDLGRRLMLDAGPLRGMIQIPGIKYGVKGVVALATLNSAIENVLPQIESADIRSLDDQAEFLNNCLTAWFEATGRREEIEGPGELDPENVAYQGRVVVSFITLIPACLLVLKKAKKDPLSEKSIVPLTSYLIEVMQRGGMLQSGKFLTQSKFKDRGFVGSGGIARLRNILWASALGTETVSRFGEDRIQRLASENRAKVQAALDSP